MNSNLTESRDIRKFGSIALIFFGGLCALGIWAQKPLPVYIFGSLASLGIAFILFPTILAPIYFVWMKIAQLFGKVFTALILTLAYYLIITPAALLKRIFGGTPLPTKPNEELSSYWVTRTEPAQPLERFIKRF